jgi:N-acetylmuramoyl-L-alanine amidase
MNRCIVPTGRVAPAPFAALLFVALLFAAAPARADAPLSAVYDGRVLHFTHIDGSSGVTAIGVEDPALQSLLSATGAFMTWRPGERYIMITTSLPTVIGFAVGDQRYDVGPIALEAEIAPYLRGDEVYLPLRELLATLDLSVRSTPSGNVLQPQLAAIDVRQDGARTTVLAHAGALLHARVVTESASAVTYAFDGVGTTIAGTREGGGAIASIVVADRGTVLEPITLLTVKLAAGAVSEPPQNIDGRDVLLAFDAAQSQAQTQPSYAGPPAETPPQSSGAAQATVNGVTVQPSADGVTVNVAVDGNATFAWHRLRDPDNRFWVDIQNAQLQGAPIDQQGEDPVVALRVRQDDPQTVRVALSLSGPNSVAVIPSATGLTITVGTQETADAARSGSGSIGNVTVANNESPVAAAPTTAPEETPEWKFAPHSGYVPTNPRLIVIDPGHGGSDRGTVHGGVAEAALALDMAKRLRTILVARGWQVKLTHDTDADVYGVDASPHDELQARVDIANNAGARMFVSVHANAYINSGPYGTTFYISKTADVPLAHAIETQMEDDGTKDDGIVKSHMYVTFHTRMPAVLIETAFLSNPSDYALLTSSAWRQKAAQEMADGIAQYAKEYPLAGQADP